MSNKKTEPTKRQMQEAAKAKEEKQMPSTLEHNQQNRIDMLRIGDFLLQGNIVTDWRIFQITTEEIQLSNQAQQSVSYHVSELNTLQFARII